MHIASLSDTSFDNYAVTVMHREDPYTLCLFDTQGGKDYDKRRCLCYPQTVSRIYIRLLLFPFWHDVFFLLLWERQGLDVILKNTFCSLRKKRCLQEMWESDPTNTWRECTKQWKYWQLILTGYYRHHFFSVGIYFNINV